MHYFAYGSNMDPQQMRRRCPGGTPIGAARLPGYRLAFTRDSGLWAGGVGHVEPDASDEVWGVLWDITPSDEAALDRYEGVASGMYVKGLLEVQAKEGPIQALIYLAVPTGHKDPSARYMRALVRGATAFGLPADYVQRLRSLP